MSTVDIAKIESTVMYERSLIGALITNPQLIDDASAIVGVSDFLNSTHRIIYTSLQAMSASSQPIDMITLMEHLEADGKLNDAGGIQGIADLTLNAGGVAENFKSYAEIVKDRSKSRLLAEAGQKISELGQAGGNDIDTSVSEAQALIDRLNQESSAKDFYRIGELLNQATDAIDNNAQNGSPGIMTGFIDFDLKTGGLKGGDLVVVAGRPSMGKTVFALQICSYAAKQDNQSAAIFSLEMTKEQLVNREIASTGSINLSRINNGELDEEDFTKLLYAVGQIKDSQLYINDIPGLSYQKIFVKARALKRHCDSIGKPLKVIAIDYLQIMGYEGSESNRERQISEISRNLKLMGKILGVAVILLAQINRGVEQRQDKRPIMSDLRESGAIEQDADLICMAYRDEYYNENSDYKGTGEILIRKQRNGATGRIGLLFEGEYVRFANMPSSYGAAFNDDFE